MALDTAHYHGWHGKLRSPWLGTLAIVRVALLQIFRRKAYWVIIALGCLNFLFCWALIYVDTQLSGLAQFRIDVLEAFDFVVHPSPDRESGYVEFMWRQSLVVMILLAFSGSLLVGADFRLNSLPFYLSRRIDRRHYIVGKLLAVSTLIALLTVLPALLLFLEYGVFTSNVDYWVENWRIPLAVLGYGVVVCAVMSTLVVTLSAYMQRTAPIAITWATLFVMLASMAGQLRRHLDSRYWSLLDPWRDMRYVGRLCFGTFPKADERELAWWALAILATVCSVSVLLLVRRVRAVEIAE
jgi:hypothetical protein